MNIILGLTGSVASVLHEKLIAGLKEVGSVEVIATDKAKVFLDTTPDVPLYFDRDEWEWKSKYGLTSRWQKGDKILHIELRNRGSALVIAPCSANTLAKLANGICDNLLTCVARAWDLNRPVIIAPAMNTAMWDHPITKQHIATLATWGYTIVAPQSKMLACNTMGMGAMAEISEIVKAVQDNLKWFFPLYHVTNTGHMDAHCPGIPASGHPAAFLAKRKHHTHTGVDLYTTDGRTVMAVENGTVVGIEDFTGVSQQSPWWEDTQCMLIEGASGVVCYGEITPNPDISVGDKVSQGRFIGRVKRVIKPGTEHPEVPGWSPAMLHIELYPHGMYKAFEELGEKPDSFTLLQDPTKLLAMSSGAPETILK